MIRRRLRDMTAADWLEVERNAYDRDEARYEAEQARAEAQAEYDPFDDLPEPT